MILDSEVVSDCSNRDDQSGAFSFRNWVYDHIITSFCCRFSTFWKINILFVIYWKISEFEYSDSSCVVGYVRSSLWWRMYVEGRWADVSPRLVCRYCAWSPETSGGEDGYGLLVNDSWCYFDEHRKMCKATAKPVPPRLLTEEEYRIQGEVETQRALQELREFCNSPECSAWKTISRIQSPKR